MAEIERRGLMRWGMGALAGAALASPASGAVPGMGDAPEIDAGRVADGKVAFPPWTAPTERPSGGPPNPRPPGERVGFAVVGLGRLALEEILPAFGETNSARLVGLVSGTPDKARLVAAQYGVDPKAVYGYGDFAGLRPIRPSRWSTSSRQTLCRKTM